VKVSIELCNELAEDEVLIRCGRVDDTIQRIHKYVLEQCSTDSNITYYKENREYYFPYNDILFFETDGDYVYAHTNDNSYRIKHRLYELEKILPKHFVRISKSSIINAAKVYSITHNITASSLVRFNKSHKQVYVSRNYYKELRKCLNERRNYEK
jgi:DNA-binding LytR/AlgR family response regulator